MIHSIVDLPMHSMWSLLYKQLATLFTLNMHTENVADSLIMMRRVLCYYGIHNHYLDDVLLFLEIREEEKKTESATIIQFSLLLGNLNLSFIQ